MITEESLEFYKKQFNLEELSEIVMCSLERTKKNNRQFCDDLYDNLQFYLVEAYRGKLYRRENAT